MSYEFYQMLINYLGNRFIYHINHYNNGYNNIIYKLQFVSLLSMVYTMITGATYTFWTNLYYIMDD